jgi:hypothetical protein
MAIPYPVMDYILMYIGIVVALRLGQHLGTILQSVFPPIMSDMRNMKERLLIIERSFCLLFSQKSNIYTNGTGYIKFDNGLIMQFGILPNALFDENHYEIAVFPIQFPHACLNVQTSVNQTQFTSGMRTAYIVDWNQSQARILPGYNVSYKVAGDRDAAAMIRANIMWFAIGY